MPCFYCFLLQLLEVLTQEIAYRFLWVITSGLMLLSRAVSEATRCLDCWLARGRSHWESIRAGSSHFPLSCLAWPWGLGCWRGRDVKRIKPATLSGICKEIAVLTSYSFHWNLEALIAWQTVFSIKTEKIASIRIASYMHLAIMVMCFQLWGFFSRVCRHRHCPEGGSGCFGVELNNK